MSQLPRWVRHVLVVTDRGAMLWVLAAAAWVTGASAAQETQGDDATVVQREKLLPGSQQGSADSKSRVGKSQELDSATQTRPITGMVVGPDGSPVAGADVYAEVDRVSHLRVMGYLDSAALPREHFERIDFNWRFRPVRRTRTDAAGRFAITLDPTGPECQHPRLIATANGFGVGTQGLVLTEAAGRLVYQGREQPAGDIRIHLPAMKSIHGRLLKLDGTPAKGVLVRIRFVTSRDGILKECHCRFEAPSEPASPGAGTGFGPERRKESRAGGTPDADIAPYLAGTESPREWSTLARTDADGWFTLDGMPDGANVYLNFFHPELATDSVIVETRPGEIHDIWRFIRPVPTPDNMYKPRRVGPSFTHTLSPACPVEGVVTAADTGKPLADVAVTVSAGGSYPQPGPTYTRTDSQGRYRATKHLATSHSLEFYPPPGSGYLPKHDRTNAASQGAKSGTKNVSLERGTIIRGRVLDAEPGEPICGASVVCLRRHPSAVYDDLSPSLTDGNGRFVLTAKSGQRLLSVETPGRSYLRSPDVGTLLGAKAGQRVWPMNLTAVDVPAQGEPVGEVLIRLRCGRTVVLQALGPDGEKLPWVGASWEGVNSTHGRGTAMVMTGFAQGRVAMRDYDSSCGRRVVLCYAPRKLGATVDIPPETREETRDVRLKPTGTIAGRLVTPDGKPAEGLEPMLVMSYDPNAPGFGVDVQGQYTEYHSVVPESRSTRSAADGTFQCDLIVAEIPLGLRVWGPSFESYPVFISIPPLAPGERRDLGMITVKPPEAPASRGPLDDPEKLLELAKRIGFVPDLSALGTDQPPKLLVVPGSPAAKAGVRSGDQLEAANGRTLKRIEAIPAVFSQLQLQKGLRLSLVREGKPVEVEFSSNVLQDLFGPKVKRVEGELFEVTFSYRPTKPVKEVYLAGTFNDWKPTAHKMDGPDKDGRFTTRLRLKEGVYEYKLVLEGKTWEADPENVLRTGFYQNSLVFVGVKP